MNTKQRLDKVLLDLQECYVMMRNHEKQRARYKCTLSLDKQDMYFEDLHYERESYNYYVGLVTDMLKEPNEKPDLERINKYKDDYIEAHKRVERYGLK